MEISNYNYPKHISSRDMYSSLSDLDIIIAYLIKICIVVYLIKICIVVYLIKIL